MTFLLHTGQQFLTFHAIQMIMVHDYPLAYRSTIFNLSCNSDDNGDES